MLHISLQSSPGLYTSMAQRDFHCDWWFCFFSFNWFRIESKTTRFSKSVYAKRERKPTEIKNSWYTYSNIVKWSEHNSVADKRNTHNTSEMWESKMWYCWLREGKRIAASKNAIANKRNTTNAKRTCCCRSDTISFLPSEEWEQEDCWDRDVLNQMRARTLTRTRDVCNVGCDCVFGQ